MVPFGGGQPYDLVVDLCEPVMLRVQCKRAWPSGGCLIFNARGTDHGRGPRSYDGLADIFGVYFPPTDSVYLVPVADVTSNKGWLRLEPTRNNQKQGVRLAVDYAFERWTPSRLREVASSGRTVPSRELVIA